MTGLNSFASVPSYILLAFASLILVYIYNIYFQGIIIILKKLEERREEG